MAFGDGADDAALDAGWAAFCDRLKAVGSLVFKDANPADPLQRADAFRFLTQNLGQAFDLALETKDARYPILHPFCTPTRKLGGDSGDFTYHQAWIDGGSVYRLSGVAGSARFFNITVQGARPDRMANGAPPLHEPFGDVPEANLMRRDLTVGADGRFEIVIGGERQGQNWLPTTAASRKLFIRQGFDAWDETPWSLTIERIGMDAPKPPPTPATMVAAMSWAGDFLAGMMADWPDWTYAHGGVDPHAVNRFPPAMAGADDVKRGRAAAAMVWALAPDEALIVEFDAHDGLWMLTNGGMFGNSMDYLYRPVSYTPARTVVDEDGRVRLVVAHDDPGFANWIDTQGFSRGHLTYRHMLEGAPVPIATRLVKRSELDTVLPCSPHVTGEARQAEMTLRFAAIRARYGW